jgi:hypothetical protein
MLFILYHVHVARALPLVNYMNPYMEFYMMELKERVIRKE